MEDRPVHLDGTPMKKFEVRLFHEAGGIRKAIYIDGELLDWSVDVNSIREAKMMGPKFFRSVQKDIQKHFVDSVSDFIGRKVTAEDIQAATKVGWI